MRGKWRPDTVATQMAIYCIHPSFIRHPCPPVFLLHASNVCQFCLCNHCLQKVVTTFAPGENVRDKFRIRGVSRGTSFRTRRLHVQALKSRETRRQTRELGGETTDVKGDNVRKKKEKSRKRQMKIGSRKERRNLREAAKLNRESGCYSPCSEGDLNPPGVNNLQKF